MGIYTAGHKHCLLELEGHNAVPKAANTSPGGGGAPIDGTMCTLGPLGCHFGQIISPTQPVRVGVSQRRSSRGTHFPGDHPPGYKSIVYA